MVFDAMKKRKELLAFLKIKILNDSVPFEMLESKKFEKFERHLISYKGSEQDDIPAYLFIPISKPKGTILVHHQHAGERHLGKSEVAGLIGDPLQHFCPALSSIGYICLAPDSICFEDRRTNTTGTNPEGEEDTLQHYNEMCYRILRGESLMKKVVEDSSIAISLLKDVDLSEDLPTIILGHSYGGNTVLFHAALDPRIEIACSSGALCSYENKMETGTGIEMAEVIPGFTTKYDMQDLLECIYPRKLLVISADDDEFSQDADQMINKVKTFYESSGNAENLIHKRYAGGHALTPERFKFILDWFGSF